MINYGGHGGAWYLKTYLLHNFRIHLLLQTLYCQTSELKKMRCNFPWHRTLQWVCVQVGGSSRRGCCAAGNCPSKISRLPSLKQTWLVVTLLVLWPSGHSPNSRDSLGLSHRPDTHLFENKTHVILPPLMSHIPFPITVHLLGLISSYRGKDKYASTSLHGRSSYLLWCCCPLSACHSVLSNQCSSLTRSLISIGCF